MTTKKPNRRMMILAVIAADVAENGKMTRPGIRAYIENRISRQVIEPAIQAGLAIYNRRGAQ